MSKVHQLSTLASKLERKYAGSLLFESGNDRITISEYLYVAANQAFQVVKLLEKSNDDPKSIKDLDTKFFAGGLIEESIDNATKALQMYKSLLKKSSGA
jgi:hypothetical protein